MMGHTLLPHHHSSTSEEQLITDNTTHTLTELIKDILSQNLGKGHLENIQKPSPLCNNIQIDVFTFLSLSHKTANNNLQLTPILKQVIKELGTLKCSLKLRGPPLA